MKKFISFIVSFVLVFSLCSTMAFASSSAGVVLSFLKDVVLSEVYDFAKSSILMYSDSISKRTEAARMYYFYKILNDDFSSGKSVFDSTGYQ